MRQYDVVVVGKGNAALCAALSARDQGATVAMLEAAPVDLSGGNSRFAGGVMRFAYSTVEELQKLADIPDDEAKNTDWDSNSVEEFYEDLYRVTSYRTDPNLSETLITRSFESMVWVRGQGAKFVPNYGSQSAIVNGKRKFFGRFPLTVNGGGAGPGRYGRDAGGGERGGVRRQQPLRRRRDAVCLQQRGGPAEDHRHSGR